jgi:hypothetical protein
LVDLQKLGLLTSIFVVVATEKIGDFCGFRRSIG